MRFSFFGSVFRLVIAGLLSHFVLLPVVQAADDEGRFHGMGAGIANCERFLKAREEQSGEYFLFGGWIDGYISSRNQIDESTYSLAPWQSIDTLAGFLGDYCAKKPDEIFLRAVMVMVEALKPQRLEESSERIAVKVGPFNADFFQEILVRIQQRLKDQGFYSGTVDGNFDPATAKALQAFQSAKLIDATGFPDQVTLFRLFHAED